MQPTRSPRAATQPSYAGHSQHFGISTDWDLFACGAHSGPNQLLSPNALRRPVRPHILRCAYHACGGSGLREGGAVLTTAGTGSRLYYCLVSIPQCVYMLRQRAQRATPCPPHTNTAAAAAAVRQRLPTAADCCQAAAAMLSHRLTQTPPSTVRWPASTQSPARSSCCSPTAHSACRQSCRSSGCRLLHAALRQPSALGCRSART